MNGHIEPPWASLLTITAAQQQCPSRTAGPHLPRVELEGRIFVVSSRRRKERGDMPGTRPARRPDGRPGPPKGYPKNAELYADPANWKYPVHTPIHAQRARQYFNKPANRAKYTAAEREFMDARINEALRRFGVTVEA
jgi:hypothetical protein